MARWSRIAAAIDPQTVDELRDGTHMPFGDVDRPVYMRGVVDGAATIEGVKPGPHTACVILGNPMDERVTKFKCAQTKVVGNAGKVADHNPGRVARRRRRQVAIARETTNTAEVRGVVEQSGEELLLAAAVALDHGVDGAAVRLHVGVILAVGIDHRLDDRVASPSSAAPSPRAAPSTSLRPSDPRSRGRARRSP